MYRLVNLNIAINISPINIYTVNYNIKMTYYILKLKIFLYYAIKNKNK